MKTIECEKSENQFEDQKMKYQKKADLVKKFPLRIHKEKPIQEVWNFY